MQVSRRISARRSWLLTALCLIAIGLLVLAFRPQTLRGTVMDANGPVAGATGRLRGSLASTTADAGGRFTLNFRGPALHRAVTAWKDGFYIAVADLTRDGHDVKLVLKPYAAQDHAGMAWLPSDANPDVELACGNCHPGLLAQWRQDAHSQTARNPLVLTMYNGTDVAGRTGVGPGFCLDFPGQAGNCASCHAPGAAVDHPEGTDLNQVLGESGNGVFCQFCHLIYDARRPDAETTTGVNAISLRRPPQGEHIFVGPYDDVPDPDTYRPIQRQSQVCAPCHSGSYWGVQAYASFDEWQASPYAAEGVQCQDCHMAPDKKTTSVVSPCAPDKPWPLIGDALCRARACFDCHLLGKGKDQDPVTSIALAPSRDPKEVFTHLSPGSRDETILRQAVTVVVTATQGTDGVLVNVAITNTGAGHHVPSDSPLRNILLLVTARDKQGRTLAQIGGEHVPAWGGQGDPAAGNYADQPGKGFAKVLEDWEGQSPAPQWRNGIHILSDNRIPARATDRSSYAFALPTDGAAAKVEAKLIFRRAFKPWADLKGWSIPDITVAQAVKTATRARQPVLAAQPTAAATQMFASSQATTADRQMLHLDGMTDPGACQPCHGQQTTRWSASGHAQATSSPLYRAWARAASQTTQGEIDRFCAGCHTPLGLLSGQIRSRWAWSGREQFPLTDQAQAGITCDICHSVVNVTGSSNGSYGLDGDSAPSLTPGPEHSSRYQRDLLTRPEFCAACHEATNPASGFAVMTTYSEWQHSRFNTGDPATTKTCQDCHFADGRHGALRLDDLQQAARLEILAPADATPGEEMAVQVRVTNVSAGHDLPTGAAELRQMWLALTVTDAAGREVFVSGRTNEYGDPVAGTAIYGTAWQDAAGHPTDRLWEAARPLADRRIPAGGAVTEIYRFSLPPDARGPLQVQATLNYRAATGYLTALMTIYLGAEVPAPPVIELAEADASLPVKTR